MASWMSTNGMSARPQAVVTTEGNNRYYYKRVKAILEAFPNKGPPFNPTRLCDHVVMGSLRNADDIALLQRIGITHVLNMAGTRRFDTKRSPYPPDAGIFRYLMIQAEDHDQYDIMKDFPAALDFIDDVRLNGGRVLVHCNLGINRSGAVVAAHLLECTQQPLLEIMSYLKLKRSVVLCNRNFRYQIIRFARAKQLLDPVEEDEEEDEQTPRPVPHKDPQISLLEKTRREAKNTQDWEEAMEQQITSFKNYEKERAYRNDIMIGPGPSNGGSGFRTPNSTTSRPSAKNAFEKTSVKMRVAPSSSKPKRRPASWNADDDAALSDGTWPSPDVLVGAMDDLSLDASRQSEGDDYYSKHSLYPKTIAVHVPENTSNYGTLPRVRKVSTYMSPVSVRRTVPTLSEPPRSRGTYRTTTRGVSTSNPSTSIRKGYINSYKNLSYGVLPRRNDLYIDESPHETVHENRAVAYSTNNQKVNGGLSLVTTRYSRTPAAQPRRYSSDMYLSQSPDTDISPYNSASYQRAPLRSPAQGPRLSALRQMQPQYRDISAPSFHHDTYDVSDIPRRRPALQATGSRAVHQMASNRVVRSASDSALANGLNGYHNRISGTLSYYNL